MLQAVEAVGGVRVKSSLLAFEQLRGADSSTLIQELVSTRVDALLIDKRIVSQRQPGGLGGDGYCYVVEIEARVLDHSSNTDRNFEVDVALERERLVSGDPVKVRVESSRDARIYLIGLYEDRVAVLLPNRFRQDTRVKAGEPLVFPDATRGEDQGLLRGEVPVGKRTATEVLLAIAIRDVEPLLSERTLGRERILETVESSGAGALLADYLRPLVRLSPDRWAFDSVAYEIVPR